MIMITGTGNENIAVEAMKLGVSNYVVKDLEGGFLQLLPSSVEQVLHLQRLADEKQEAERALRESEERYRLLVENAPLGIISVDSQGRIKETNRALSNLPDSLSADETSELDIRKSKMLIKAGIADKLRDCLESGESSVSEHSYVSEESSRVHLRIYVSPTRNADGGITEVQAIIENITEQKRLEERIQQRDRMEALGQLAGGIAHDYNNILIGITLSAQMLQSRYPRRWYQTSRPSSRRRSELPVWYDRFWTSAGSRFSRPSQWT